MKRVPPLFLLVGGLALGVALLAYQSQNVSMISHDDGISYLAATGHQGMYANHAPVNQWVTASEWQSFWKPDQFWIFSTIANDLASYDIHPPLYFWLLHIWCNVRGVAWDTGPLLNILFHVIAVLGIVWACRRLHCSPWISAVAGILWLLSGPILLVAVETRQYSLLGAVVSCFAAGMIEYLNRPSWISLFVLFLFCLAGLLTHYHFGLLMAILGAISGLQLALRKAWRPLWGLFIALFVAIISFCTIHPSFLMSVARQPGQVQEFVLGELFCRVETFLRSLFECILPYSPADAMAKFVSHFWLLLMSICLVMVVMLLLVVNRRGPGRVTTFLRGTISLPLLGWFITAGVVGVLYISFLSPRHAMGAKYMMICSPMLFICIGQVLSAMVRKRPLMGNSFSLVLVALQVVFGIQSVAQAVDDSQQLRGNYSFSASHSPLVLDSAARGVLPRLLWHLHPSTLVLAGFQKDLINRLPVLQARGPVRYASHLGYGNTLVGQQAILRMFEDCGGQVLRHRKAILGIYDLYEYEMIATPVLQDVGRDSVASPSGYREP